MNRSHIILLFKGINPVFYLYFIRSVKDFAGLEDCLRSRNTQVFLCISIFASSRCGERYDGLAGSVMLLKESIISNKSPPVTDAIFSATAFVCPWAEK